MLFLTGVLSLAAGSLAGAEPGTRLPKFDIAGNCGAESTISTAIAQSADMCRRDETAARDELSKQWSQYDADSRRTCTYESGSGSSQSYVELQTCLEMTDDVQKERRQWPLS
jgi:hypothetical protein